MEKNYQVTPKGLSKICHTIVAQKGFCKLYNLVNILIRSKKKRKNTDVDHVKNYFPEIIV